MKNNFEDQCEKQGWNLDSQVNIFTDFLKSNKLFDNAAVYAGQYAEMENSVSVDLGVSSLEDFEQEQLQYQNKSFEEIAYHQGWDNSSKLNIMKAFVTENKLVEKFSNFSSQYN